MHHPFPQPTDIDRQFKVYPCVAGTVTPHNGLVFSVSLDSLEHIYVQDVLSTMSKIIYVEKPASCGPCSLYLYLSACCVSNTLNAAATDPFHNKDWISLYS